jgi:hypothetical protein
MIATNFMAGLRIMAGLSSAEWVQGLYGVMLFFGAVALYMTRPKPSQGRSDPVLAGVGLGLSDHAQAERAIDALESIARDMRTLADTRVAGMDQKLDALLSKLAAR